MTEDVKETTMADYPVHMAARKMDWGLSGMRCSKTSAFYAGTGRSLNTLDPLRVTCKRCLKKLTTAEKRLLEHQGALP
jgi:hypothetical protein